MSKIRLLTAADIDVRVGSKSKKGDKAQLLLYKDARVDMAVLDEVYGKENWQTQYAVIGDVLFCGIGVFLNNQWVWKWSNGVESKGQEEGNNTKGEASDAIKRAGFLWGIGRELYNCKGIWVDITAEEYLAFSVKEIAFNEQTLMPTRLLIVDSKGNKRYELGKHVESPKQPDTQTLPPVVVKDTVPQEKIVVAPKNDQSLLVVSQEQLNALKDKVKAQNAIAQQKIIRKAYEVLASDYKQDEAVKKAKEFMVAFLTEELKLNFKNARTH